MPLANNNSSHSQKEIWRNWSRRIKTTAAIRNKISSSVPCVGLYDLLEASFGLATSPMENSGSSSRVLFRNRLGVSGRSTDAAQFSNDTNLRVKMQAVCPRRRWKFQLT